MYMKASIAVIIHNACDSVVEIALFNTEVTVTLP
jgi:hypothetical protein